MSEIEPTLEDRVAALEHDAIETTGSITSLAGLLRRVTGHQSTVADSWFKVVTSHEFPQVLQLSGTPVVDVACPKCGTNAARLIYCDSAVIGIHVREADRCMPGDPEHFHRSCARCSYMWRTDDVCGTAAGAE